MPFTIYTNVLKLPDFSKNDVGPRVKESFWIYTVLQFNAHATLQIFLWSRFVYSKSGHILTKLLISSKVMIVERQTIPNFLALDVGVKIYQAQLCSSIKGCHATYLIKNTLFKGEVVWQPLKELQICSSSILDQPARAFKWGIVCLSTIITFEDIRGYFH